MIETEAQRQFYLGTAGIRLWYARAPLPGAAPSPEFEFPEPEETRGSVVGLQPRIPAEPASRNNTGIKNGQGGKRIASLQALMAGTPKQSSEPRQETIDPVPPASTHAAGDTARPEPLPAEPLEPALSLSLGVFSGPECVLIAYISKEASLRLQETLAANILCSIGVELSKPVQWVHWPVFNNRLVPGGSLAGFRAVMQQVLSEIAGRKVLVLGGSENVGASDPVRDWLAEAHGRSADVQSTYSLAELASRPDKKRALWAQLKHLVAIQ